jgi:zinc/manganese transport system ATP-binding protein
MESHDIDIMKKYADEYLLLAKHGSEYEKIDHLDVAKLKEGGQILV